MEVSELQADELVKTNAVFESKKCMTQNMSQNKNCFACQSVAPPNPTTLLCETEMSSKPWSFLHMDLSLFSTWRLFFARREAKTRIWQRDCLKLAGEKIRREQVGSVPTFLSVRANKVAKWK